MEQKVEEEFLSPNARLARQKLHNSFNLGYDFKLLESIGSGAYGEVIMAKHVKSGIDVAVKKVDGSFFIMDEAKQIVREIKLLRAL